MGFTFFHAADLHLDSPFKTQAPTESRIAQDLRMAAFVAFDRLIDACIDEEAAFLLVAGDVFDGLDRSLRAQLRFHAGLCRLAEEGIPAFVVHGNHDALEGWVSSLAWPEKVCIFPGDKVETRLTLRGDEPIAAISGISYPTRDVRTDLSEQFNASRPDLFQVALLHANAGNTGHENYAPFQLESICRKGFDYWALGHVHAHQVLRAADPAVVYPGVLQGRHVRETGPCGACRVLVDDQKKAQVEFVPFDTIRWAVKAADISACATLDAVDKILGQALQEAMEEADGRPTVCRLIAKGETSLYGELETRGGLSELLEGLQEQAADSWPGAWPEKIESHLRPEINLDARMEEEDLLGELLRIADDLLDAENPADALEPAIGPLEKYLEEKNLLEGATETELRQALREAMSLCAWKLERPQ